MSLLPVRASLGGLHRGLRRAYVPVLWGAVAVAAGALWWFLEDPMLTRGSRGL